MEHFDQLFKSAKALAMGLELKRIIESHLDNLEATIAGGAKVKLLLYSRGGKNNVLCGIQEGSGESCMLYVHHVAQIEHERLKFSGKGRHAKRIKFNALEEIVEADVRWLLDKVEDGAPY